MGVHTVFKPYLLKERLPHGKIEAIASYYNKVMIGTADGSLLLYLVTASKDPNTGADKFIPNASDCRAGFAEKKKAINQLVPLPELDLLLTLVDGQVLQHKLKKLQPKNPVRGLKGCSIFAVKKDHGKYVMAAVVKKKLYLYDWGDSEEEFLPGKEFLLPDTPKVLAWSGTKVCLGFSKDYTLLDVLTGTSQELFTTGGKSKNPFAQAMDDMNELFLVKDNVGITVDMASGKPTRKFGTSLSDVPVQLGYTAPYIVSLHPNFLEVHNPSIQNGLCQTVPIKGAERLSTTTFSNMDLATQRINDQPQEFLFVATADNSLWVLDFVPFPEQVRQLYDDGQYDPALNLCKLLNRHDEVIPAQFLKEIQLQNGYACFAASQFREAMQNFAAAEVDPALVIQLYPDLLPKYIRDVYSSIQTGQRTSTLVTTQALAEENLRVKALEEIIPFLKRHRKPPEASDEYSDPLAQDTSPEGMRAAAVDTALLKAYIVTTEAEAKRFVTIPNSCVVEDCERALKKEQKWEELVLFYQHKGLHRRALMLLQKLGQEAIKEQGMPPYRGTGVYYDFEYTIEYIQRLNNSRQIPPAADTKKLILEFSVWLLKALPIQHALRAFFPIRAEDIQPNARYLLGPPIQPARILDGVPATVVPPEDVMRHLENQKSTVLADTVNARISYLEKIIHVYQHQTPELHEALILLYLNRIQSLKGQAECAPLIDKLFHFLRESQHYDATKLLVIFPDAELHELRAILLSRVGEHTQALNLYAHKMKDHAKAMEYCQSVYNSSVPGAKDIFVQLLQTYLRPPEGRAPMIAEALDLISSNFSRTDPLQALDLLPGNATVQELSSWLTAVLKHTSLQRRSLQIQKNLLKTQNIAAREEYATVRNNHITVDEKTACQQCGKKIGNAVFAWVPNTQPPAVMHYQCMEADSRQTKKFGGPSR